MIPTGALCLWKAERSSIFGMGGVDLLPPGTDRNCGRSSSILSLAVLQKEQLAWTVCPQRTHNILLRMSQFSLEKAKEISLWSAVIAPLPYVPPAATQTGAGSDLHPWSQERPVSTGLSADRDRLHRAVAVSQGKRGVVAVP